MDVLDTGENNLKSIEIDSILESLPLWYKKAVMERDYEAEDALKRMNRWRQVWFTTCPGTLGEQKIYRSDAERAEKAGSGLWKSC